MTSRAGDSRPVVPPGPGRPGSPIPGDDSCAGVTLVEVLISMALTLVITLAVFQFVDSSRRLYVQQRDQADAQSVGRASMDLFTAELGMAGYDPLGLNFNPIPVGNASTVQLIADVDGDGVVGTASEPNENLTYTFVGPDTEGLYELQRGVDLNGDGDFADSGESVDILSPSVLPIDFDDDGTVDPFLEYNLAPPLTGQVKVTFGIRTDHYDFLKGSYAVVRFQTSAALRNVILRYER